MSSPEMGIMMDSAQASLPSYGGASRMQAEILTPQDSGSKIKVNGSLSLEVDDIDEASKMVRILVLSDEGRISNSDTGSF